MNISRFKVPVLLFMVGLLVFSGCSKLTQENYDKIKVGMTYQEVKNIIGDPDECDSALVMKNCSWGDNEKYIKIQFIADKVVMLSGRGL